MRFLSVAAAVACLAPTMAMAGQIVDKTDRFRGTRTVSWESFRDPERSYSYNVYAQYAKADDPTPRRYYALLALPAGSPSYASCDSNAWLVDGARVPELTARYDASSGAQLFNVALNQGLLERLAKAQSVEFKICNTEAAISPEDLAGVRELLERIR